MNLMHRWLCGSARWKKVVETHILPWTLEGLDLGGNVLEVGPGPGVSTDLLRARVARLSCVEVNHAQADRLRRRKPIGMSGWYARTPRRCRSPTGPLTEQFVSPCCITCPPPRCKTDC